MLGEKCLQRGQGGGHKQGNSDAHVVSLFVYCGIWCCEDAERILAIKAIRFVKSAPALWKSRVGLDHRDNKQLCINKLGFFHISSCHELLIMKRCLFDLDFENGMGFDGLIWCLLIRWPPYSGCGRRAGKFSSTFLKASGVCGEVPSQPPALCCFVCLTQTVALSLLFRA